ncbi:MAG: Xaa-Pro peptidase family protein [Actinomycetota bacterium]
MTLPPLTVAGRIDTLRSAMAERDLDGFVVVDLPSVRWLTGFTGSNGLVAVTAGAAVLATDGRYATQAPAQLEAAGAAVTVVIGQDLVAGAAGSLGGAARVALEGDVVSWDQQRRWASTLSEIELVPVSGLIRELRSVKDPAELARIQAAAAIADHALAETESLRIPGTTERALGLALDDTMRVAGASGPAYETIVASGPNAALPHARPSDRAFETGDLLIIDVGALVDGYRSDMTRSFVIGGPDAAADVAREILPLVTEAQAVGVATVAPGREAKAIDAACRSVIADAGLGDAFSHGTGHGVGLDIHELPSIRKDNAAILQAGQVLTVEPGVYLPGVGGVRVEDLVVVTDSGCRPLTLSPKLSL